MSKSDAAEAKSFWNWFEGSADRLKQMVENRDTEDIACEFNTAIDRIDPRIAWEVGPGKEREVSLTLSSEGNPELREVVDRLVGTAPQLTGWEFYAYRQPRPAPPTVRLPKQNLEFSTATWKFSPFERPDLGRIDLLVVDDALAAADREIGLRAVFIFLDALLGEEAVEKWLGDIEITAADRARGKVYEMADLPDYVLWATNRERNPLSG